MKQAAEWIKKEAQYHLPTYNRFPLMFQRGKGVHLWDSEGKRYTDFFSGLGVVNLGHCHPEVIEAFWAQANNLIHVSNLFYTQPQINLAQQLIELSFPGKCFFANSGAEANEGAIKLARRWGKTHFKKEKYQIITAFRSFHGRTLKALAATGQPEKQEPFQPLPGGFKHVPYNDIEALSEAINEQTCAVLLEVIQGEGGVYPAEEGYLKEVRRICDERETLLILDEIQTGLGRTGKFFAYQHQGIEPDILTLAKGLANGLPIGTFIAKEEIADVFTYGDHGSTFGGGPAICAAASATLKVLQEEKLANRAASLGRFFQEKLVALKEANSEVQEVRGQGLMWGLEINSPRARDIVLVMLNQGFIINNIGPKILRFLPPLIITKEEIKEMLEALSEVIKGG